MEEHSNTHRTPYLFNGKELDEETGLYYYGARYYDAQTSVWLSVDPLAEKFPGWSPYNYNFNNPVTYVDPNGQEPLPVTNNRPTWASKWGFLVHQTANAKYIYKNGEMKDYKTDPIKLKALNRATVVADGDEFQTGAMSFRHAMRDKKPQTPEGAKQLADTFVRKQFNDAKKLLNEGNLEEAYFQFGLGLHTLQDATSPAHGGFKEWSGEESLLDQINHAGQELFYPGEDSHLQKITDKYLDWFENSNEPLPTQNLFDDIKVDEKDREIPQRFGEW